MSGNSRNHSFQQSKKTNPGRRKVVKSENKPTGLINLGNTCYFNAVLQTLCHTHSLSSELGLLPLTQDGSLRNSFLGVSQKLQTGGSDTTIDTTEVRKRFVRKVPRFGNFKQHDSHECLRHFLDEIRKEEREANTSSGVRDFLTAVDKVFGGHLITVYTCKACKKQFHLFEPSLDISLPIVVETVERPTTGCWFFCSGSNQRRGTKKKQKKKKIIAVRRRSATMYNKSKKNRTNINEEKEYEELIGNLTTRLSDTDENSNPDDSYAIRLHDCLKYFSKEENIDRDYLCKYCVSKQMKKRNASEDNLKLTSATKQTLIFNPPAVLTIHLKRFELLSGGAKKRSDFVRYPEFLDIAPHCSEGCLRNDPPRSNIWYSLYAVVVHYGSLDRGHYVAFVKMREREENIKKLNTCLQKGYFNHNATAKEVIEMLGRNDRQEPTERSKPMRDFSRWYLLNDDSVDEVFIKDVLKQEAYLLFYERVDDVVFDRQKFTRTKTL